MSGLTPRTVAWRDGGSLTDLGGRRIFVRERSGDAGRPPLLFLHGYPSSSYDWRHLFTALPGHRLLTFDFLGYGFSEKPRDVVYSLRLQADIAEQVAARLNGEPVVLVAHDMGSSVATELLARDLDGRLSFPVRSTLLFNASMVRERASLLWGQKLLLSRFGPIAARLTNRASFTRQFAGIFSDGHPLTDEEAADQWSLLAHHGGHRLLDRLIFYNRERVTSPTAERWHGALREWPGRLGLAWADQDPIATEAVLQAVMELRPHAELQRLRGLGHYPMAEDPAAAAAVVEQHLAPAA